MKKFLISFICVCLVCSAAFAVTFDKFSLNLFPGDTLYKESHADPYAFESSFRTFWTLTDEKPTKVLAVIKDGSTSETFYDWLPIGNDFDNPKYTNFYNMKGGFSFGLLRFDFSKVAFEFSAAGYINAMFCNFMKQDCLDFDGSYFVGATLKLANTVAVRFGIHHFSGHYGDEVLEKIYSNNKVDFGAHFTGNEGAKINNFQGSDSSSRNLYLVEPVEYVRDNSWIVAVSADLPAGLRPYAELEVPRNPSWVRPLVHCPADYKNPTPGKGGDTMMERIGGYNSKGEYFEPDEVEDEENLKRASNGLYNAFRVHFGMEWEKYINDDFGVFAAFDIQLHQDGQSLHRVGSYSPDNPWENEITVAMGSLLPSLIRNHSVSLELMYHHGRLPATQWFYQRCDIITLGISVR